MNSLTQPTAEALTRLLRFSRNIYWRDAHVGSLRKKADVVLTPEQWHVLQNDIASLTAALGLANIAESGDAPSTLPTEGEAR